MANFYDVVRDAATNFGTDLIPGVQMQTQTMARLNSLIAYDFANMLQTNTALVKEAQELFEYKGMDIWVILQKYLQKAKDDRDAENNLIYMIVALCERGTNFNKFKNKMSTGGRQSIEQIAAKYALVTKLSPDIANELTLARIGMPSPCWCAATSLQLCPSLRWTNGQGITLSAWKLQLSLPSFPLKLVMASPWLTGIF